MSELKVGMVNAATPTPLNPDGTFDREAGGKLCRRWVDIGLDGVFVLGSMGEGPFLSDEVRNAFLETALEEVGDRLTVFAGAADVSRDRMMERALRYAKMGAHCVVLCLPSKVPEARAIADVKAVADACPTACAYYDAPANTGTPLALEQVLDILAHENIPVCKDSSNNALLAQGLTSAAHRPDCFLLDGCEYRTPWSRAVGYDGVLHGGGVMTGKWVRAIWGKAEGDTLAEAMAMDREKALFLARIYNRFSKPLQNAVGQKYALGLLGCGVGETMAIDQQLDDASRERIRLAVEAAREWLA